MSSKEPYSILRELPAPDCLCYKACNAVPSARDDNKVHSSGLLYVSNVMQHLLEAVELPAEDSIRGE